MGLATFKGGIHPPDKKILAANSPIVSSKPPKIAVIPLSQHIGAPCNAIVTIGQEVKKGEVVGEPAGFVSSPGGFVSSAGGFSSSSGGFVSAGFS